jgi:tetrahydromethanopterin S-methyltransferase subunit G
MKYVILTTMFVVVAYLVSSIILDAESEFTWETVVDKVKELGRNIHWFFGVLAVLIAILMVVRLVFQVFRAF